MIHEEICTYEVCKLAKEKGLNEYVEAFYAEGCDTAHTQGPEKWNEYKGRYAAPTQGQLQRWLREEMGVIIEAIAQPTCSTPKKNCYWWSIKQNSDGLCYQYEECSYILYSDKGYFITYELALEDALKYVLKKLIK